MANRQTLQVRFHTYKERGIQSQPTSWVMLDARGTKINQGTGDFIFKKDRVYEMDGVRYIVNNISFGIEGFMHIKVVNFTTFLLDKLEGNIMELIESDRQI
ncbi:hypothetical protein BCPG3_168 [Bacillus phage BCPG3]|uniref:Uncharacterized protein n=1 Tax=Bacillus phage SalinJah TaxID=1837830 RepID=A0A173GBK6_9CAUD|nr:hypothetical protein SALINJAH_163 [Bacillus phage SalinJah]ANH50583.1 hypothetical protein SALINJAH_163 [Bacillus phage SalinJah]QQO38820.1 hypothetical protein BCPG1_089 [Bacillus phage BCPG1]QSJ04485.1 hypothetical protein BCPG3_168 [Bacillus phage BCPG3]QSJ04695.1 hypothetical protein BCP18_163 [Bacillus phage BCP18]